MSSMQLQDIRAMGETLASAREMCQQAQYDQGMATYQLALDRLQQFIRRMHQMSERQPWLQMQIELENELSLITDYVELVQAFKVHPGSGQGAPVVGKTLTDDGPSNGWEVYTPDARKQAEERDPDVWGPPSPENLRGRGEGGGGGGSGRFPARRGPPAWANNDDGNSNNNNNNGRGNNRGARTKQAGAGQRGGADRPSGRRTPSDEQRARATGRAPSDNRRHGGKNPAPVTNSKAVNGKQGKSTGSTGSGSNASGSEVNAGAGAGRNEKKKYSELAREEGMVDIDLIEMIERDIVDTAAKITFDNIAGLEHTKQLLQEAVMLPQIAPHLFKDGRLKPCSGVLMFGPPGTGKTLLAKAVANVCNTTFFNVSASTLASKYRGESEKMVRVLFDMARYHSPAIIFMDEIDAIAGARGGSQEHESSRRVKTELMVQMNGVSSGDPGDPSNRVMVLAATNLPWELDEAMRRRLTKRVYIPLPGEDGRRQLFKLNLEKVDVAPDADYDKLVAETHGYSGDDICGLCETAKMMPVKRLYTPEVLKELHRKKQEGASEEELQAHEKNALVVTWADFQMALENVSKSVGQDQLDRFAKWEEEFGSK